MTQKSIRFLKALLFLLCLVPLAKLALEIFGVGGMSLGANPIEELIHRLGIWGLNFLLITLAVTPLRRLTGKGWLLRFRRMFGLFAFFYVLLHFLTYAGLDQRFDLPVIVEDIVERPFITVGFTAFLLLIPLALTSTNAMMRRLGRRWLEPDRAVFASLAFEPAWPIEAWNLIPLAAGLAARSAIDGLSGVTVGLRWPNDLILGDGKVGGLLAESGDGVVIVGCGINVLWETPISGGAALYDDDPGPAIAARLAEGWADRLLDLMALHPQDSWIQLSHMLIHHGRQVCIARRPRCAECPLRLECPSAPP